MRIFLSFLLLASVACIAPHGAQAQGEIKKQAREMGEALIAKNYLKFTNYTYPQILKEMGGREKMAESIKKQMEGMEKTGVQITSLEYGTPSEIIKENKEWQCTIPQVMKIKTKDGIIQATGTLIAVSKDNGGQWYFVDTGERDLEAVRISLPNISKKLVLPPAAPPQMIRD